MGSTSMAVLLRELGIPSRHVTGFAGGTYNRFGGYYVVRRSDAHAWVEAYVDGRWVTFDPTPAQASGFSRAFAFSSVSDAFEASSKRWSDWVEAPMGRLHAPRIGVSVVGWIVLVAAMALVIWLVSWRLRPRLVAARPSIERAQRRDATQLWLDVEAALAELGISRPHDVPPVRFAEQLRARDEALGDEVLVLATAYAAARFGGRELTADEAASFAERVAALRGRTRVE